MRDLGPQVWHQRRGKNQSPSASMLDPISERHCGSVKPTGGLWTSTLTDDGSDWVRWCLDESFAGPQFHLWQLEPDPAARIYTINDLADLLTLCNRFPPICDHQQSNVCTPLRLSRSEVSVGWRRVAEAYDAVHLTDDGQWATRLSLPADLYGWDCESTLWFRWRFTDIRPLGTRTFQPREVALIGQDQETSDA